MHMSAGCVRVPVPHTVIAAVVVVVVVIIIIMIIDNHAGAVLRVGWTGWRAKGVEFLASPAAISGLLPHPQVTFSAVSAAVIVSFFLRFFPCM
jgi:hypothetical protein